MKNLLQRVVLCVLAILGFEGNTTYAQSTYYYYGYERITLEPVTGKVLVKFRPGGNFSSHEAMLKDPIIVEPITRTPSNAVRNLFVVNTKDGTTITQVEQYIEKVKEMEEVASASLFYMPFGNGQLTAQMDEVFVKLPSIADLPLLEEDMATLALEVVGTSDLNPETFLLRTTKASSGNAIKIANRLQESGKYLYAEPNFFIEANLHSADPLYSQQWSLENTGTNTAQWGGTPDADIDANEAWAHNYTGQRVVIAIVDTGVELTHPDLVNNMLNGFDALGANSNGAAVGQAHGTACAGIAAAEKDNDIGIAGVAPNAYIMPIRIWENSAGTWDQIANGLDYALCNGADVVSLSWGINPGSSTIDDAIYRLVTFGRAGKGAVVIASAGNYGWQPPHSPVNWPASNPHVIAVGASTMCNTRKVYFNFEPQCEGEDFWGSNYTGGDIDLVAPGVKMPTTDLTGTAGYSHMPYDPNTNPYPNTNYGNGDYITDFRGTSASAPVVAGVAALIISVNRCFSGHEVREILEVTANKVNPLLYNYAQNPNKPHGNWNIEMGYGVVNANNAVIEAINRGNRICPPLRACVGGNVDRVANLSEPKVDGNFISYFPNPFSNSVSFSYQLPAPSMVNLTVTDALGRTVDKIFSTTTQPAGNNELTYSGDKLPEGLYFFILNIGDIVSVQKLVKID